MTPSRILCAAVAVLALSIAVAAPASAKIRHQGTVNYDSNGRIFDAGRTVARTAHSRRTAIRYGVSRHQKFAVARHHYRHHRSARAVDRPSVGGLITVATAAGPITVNSSVASAFQGFISDVVARGYHPRKVHCYSMARSHVRRSNHKWGGACDFDQRGWNKTAGPMYHVGDLARKWGLRDGCSFRDCGHIDAAYMRMARR